MTENQALSHAEQMEARRNEFNEWIQEAYPRIGYGAIRVIAWKAFLKGCERTKNERNHEQQK